MIGIAYNEGHMDIVRCIQTSGRVMLFDQLRMACTYDDLTFVSQCVSTNKDNGQDVDWITLIFTAYMEGCTDIVRHIRESGRVSLIDQLSIACNLGDLTFVS